MVAGDGSFADTRPLTGPHGAQSSVGLRTGESEVLELLAKGFNIWVMMIGGPGTALDAYALLSKELQESREQHC